jgi:regulator of sigma E protease
VSNWYSIIFGLIMLGLIIVFHEFGHFIVAKKNGVGVVEFAVGMGPALCSKIKNGTRYVLRLIPIGGMCMMLGDDNGIPDPEMAAIVKDDESSFQSKSVWVRIAVIFAGPFFNFVLAFVLAVIVLGIAGVDKPILSGVIDGYPAQSAGLVAGDQITKINNTTIRTSRDISLFMDEYVAGTTLNITVKRDGSKQTYTVIPEWSDEYEKYMIGISWSTARNKVGAIETLGYSFNEVGYWIKLTFKSLGMLFTGGASVNDLSGPVGVVDIVDETVEASKTDGALYIFLNLANLCILLSANIGVMNLLPIPALDGGRLLFLIIEALRGKPIDKKKEGYVHIAGFLFLILLMVFVMFNDIRKIIAG